MTTNARTQPTTPATPAGDEQTTIMVAPEYVGQRLDKALASVIPGLSRTRAQAAIAAGRVLVNHRPAKASLVLEEGMILTLQPAHAASPAIARPGPAAPAPLSVVYEDDAILVIDKPAGLVVHPAPGHERDTLVDALLAHVPDLDTAADPTRPGIVHRLDKDTSGLMIIAKTPESHTALARQMQAHTTVKRYLALVEGQMTVSEGVVEAPIGRDPRNRQRMAVVSLAAGGREARTRFRVLRSIRGRTYVELQLETGRTHQIRVHLAAIHHPVVGDLVYGRPQPPLPPRQFLHAAHLEFTHPVTDERMAFDVPLPPDLAVFLARLEEHPGHTA